MEIKNFLNVIIFLFIKKIEMEKDLKELFEEIDEDKSGLLDI